MDAKDNLVADFWDVLFYGGLTNVFLDTDNDGVNGQGEYYSGTNPTNAGDVLEGEMLVSTNPGTLTLTWPVKAGKQYRVMCSDDLTSNLWLLTSGPTEAPTNGHLSWTATNLTGALRTYRVEVCLP